jgi:hypothetical protein
MKTLLAIVAMSLVGCASPMMKLNPGMSRDEVISKIGQPDGRTVNGDSELLTYSWTDGNGFKNYSAVILNDGKVSKFGEWDQVFPPSAAALKARTAAAQMMLQIQQQRQPSSGGSKPTQIYNPGRNTQTNCTSQVVGNQIMSDCSSRPTGIDASIYGR